MQTGILQNGDNIAFESIKSINNSKDPNIQIKSINGESVLGDTDIKVQKPLVAGNNVNLDNESGEISVVIPDQLKQKTYEVGPKGQGATFTLEDTPSNPTIQAFAKIEGAYSLPTSPNNSNFEATDPIPQGNGLIFYEPKGDESAKITVTFNESNLDMFNPDIAISFETLETTKAKQIFQINTTLTESMIFISAMDGRTFGKNGEFYATPGDIFSILDNGFTPNNKDMIAQAVNNLPSDLMDINLGYPAVALQGQGDITADLLPAQQLIDATMTLSNLDMPTNVAEATQFELEGGGLEAAKIIFSKDDFNTCFIPTITGEQALANDEVSTIRAYGLTESEINASSEILMNLFNNTKLSCKILVVDGIYSFSFSGVDIRFIYETHYESITTQIDYKIFENRIEATPQGPLVRTNIFNITGY